MKRFGVRDMRIWGVTFLAGALALSGCDGALSPKASEQQAASVPEAVQKLIDTPFAADGQIHVQSRGAIVIRQDALFCYFDDTPTINAGDTIRALGQSYYTHLIKREVLATGKPCQNDLNKNVFLSGLQSSNRLRKPYKLVLAVWQGDVAKGGAYWVGGVERLDGLHPSVPRNDGTDPNTPKGTVLFFQGQTETIQEWIDHSIGQDVRGLSQSFVQFIRDRNAVK